MAQPVWKTSEGESGPRSSEVLDPSPLSPGLNRRNLSVHTTALCFFPWSHLLFISFTVLPQTQLAFSGAFNHISPSSLDGTWWLCFCSPAFLWTPAPDLWPLQSRCFDWFWCWSGVLLSVFLQSLSMVLDLYSDSPLSWTTERLKTLCDLKTLVSLGWFWRSLLFQPSSLWS